MQAVLLSDIHGNYIALRKCIDYALNRNIETFIFLGDYVGELAYPQKTMKLLYSMKEKYQCHFLRGNKEDYWINYQQSGEKGWKENDSTTGSLFYTYHNLTPKDIAFFKQLPYTCELHFEGLPALTICHGSPARVNEKLLPDSENTFQIMVNNENQYILCGHTHVQGLIEHNQKCVINPGAVGVSLHSSGKAQFAILTGHDDRWGNEWISLDYDAEQTINDLHTSQLSKKASYWCKVTENLLRTGEISHGQVLERAMAICREETGKCNWPDIPEECWQKAVRELIGS